MTPHKHSRSWFVVHLALFFALIVSVMGLAISHVGNLDQLFTVRTLIIFAALSLGFSLVDMLLFRLFIHAQCPDCGARLRVIRQDPVTYSCPGCGIEQGTHVQIRYGSRSH
ncbi:hypothetical protein Mal4_53910 [Maioricimonas rarisocia]|uniref:Uncharacterized protein n=1 Tax=Maioricimonas rarisocia TaxID=2528026 RepID=A0A517ZEY6_9PLAN|nr:hypothetical protein [Maioricimonas rarisocia]QDU41026.1 hypothetical protein Mal4_53910 [Maioricimonas rarisocia]